MRSRYSAFVVGDEPYLLRTWHPSTRPERVEPDPQVRWLRLEVLATTGGHLLDGEGTVAFVAHHDGGELHENSRFVRENGRWVYVGV
jgi:SEC-C motif-containing protein